MNTHRLTRRGWQLMLIDAKWAIQVMIDFKWLYLGAFIAVSYVGISYMIPSGLMNVGSDGALGFFITLMAALTIIVLIKPLALPFVVFYVAAMPYAIVLLLNAAVDPNLQSAAALGFFAVIAFMMFFPSIRNRLTKARRRRLGATLALRNNMREMRRRMREFLKHYHPGVKLRGEVFASGDEVIMEFVNLDRYPGLTIDLQELSKWMTRGIKWVEVEPNEIGQLHIEHTEEEKWRFAQFFVERDLVGLYNLESELLRM